ncbi:MAG: methylmalonyl-CoA epimerase [Deltaproteobacteria bacterium]|nr:methylmalonyl-CoA epimerase [Deltaproteobacteria bacterium]
MLSTKGIDHVAVAVRDMDEALPSWCALLGVEPASRELVAAQQTEAALFPVGEGAVELIAPRGNAGLERFLQSRGPGLHHIALQVEGIEQALAALAATGVPLIDRVARPGARGHKVAFLHPKATGGVLVELVEPAERGGNG